MIRDFLADRPTDQIVFRDSCGMAITISTIQQLHLSCQHLLNKAGTQSVALSFQDNLIWALSLILFDGIARRITLIPPDIDSDTLSRFCRESAIDILFTDQPKQTTGKKFFLLNRQSLLNNISETTETNTTTIKFEQITTEWILSTSGTTGEPKLVKYSFSSLSHTVKNKKPGSLYTWGLLYNIYRFAGLQVFLQALAGHSELILTDRTWNLQSTLQHFSRHGCNALSATPTMWRKILMQGNAVNLQLKTITLGGEIADQMILTALSNAFPHARVRHIYASTEAGVGFSVCDGQEGFPCTFLNNSASAVLLAINDDGLLLIKSKSSSQGYMDQTLSQENNEGFINTGDRVVIKGQRVFFLGRDNGVINIGGNKVHPEEVENILLQYPGVRLAIASGRTSPITGALVQANIVIDNDIEDHPHFIKLLKKFCRLHLDDFKIPVLIKIQTKLKAGASGKMERLHSD